MDAEVPVHFTPGELRHLKAARLWFWHGKINEGHSPEERREELLARKFPLRPGECRWFRIRKPVPEW